MAAVTPEERARILELLADPEWTVTAIAAEMHRGKATISRIAKAHEEELGAARSAANRARTPAEALEVRLEKLAERRRTIKALLLERAEELLEAMEGGRPHEVHHFTKEGELHTGTLTGPTSTDRRNYAVAVGVMLDKFTILEAQETDDDEARATVLELIGTSRRRRTG